MKDTILIAGGSGMIGQALSAHLVQSGFEVRILSRSERKHDTYAYFLWDPAGEFIDMKALANVHTVVNLAGAGIVDKRWTASRKTVVLNSRLQSTNLLVASIARLPEVERPRLVNASAIGYYGDSGSEVLNEAMTVQPTDFLSRVTQAWESAALAGEDLGIRVSIVRIGIVLSKKGGALPQFLKSYKFGVAGYFGDGSQYYSYIHIDDLVAIFEYIIKNQLSGIYNAVGNNPVTNKEMAHAIARARNQSALPVSIPTFAVKLGMGEMSEALLNSNRVSNAKIREAGYKFKFEGIEAALRDLL